MPHYVTCTNVVGNSYGQMRLLIALILISVSVPSLYGQIEVELYFKNDCNNTISRLEFDLFNLDNKTDRTQSKDGIAIVLTKGTYHLSSNYIWGDNMVGMFDHTINIEDPVRQVDTLIVPMIKFTGDAVLHSKTPYWNYFKCEKLCDGHETDFYPNGQKRLEGVFVKGKPNHIIEYRPDGTKETESWFILGTQFYKRVEYFDESGKLDEYDDYKNEKHRTVKTTYTAQGKRVGREVTKHTIEK